MKNIIVIAVIGKNQLYSPGGYLTLEDRDNCDVHFGIRDAKNSCHYIVVSKELFAFVPDGPPFYEHCEICVIDAESHADPNQRIEPRFPNVLIADSLEEALLLTDDDEQKIFVIADKHLYHEMLERYSERISSIEVITLEKSAASGERFIYPPPLQFQPVITKDEHPASAGKPAFTVHSWDNEPLPI